MTPHYTDEDYIEGPGIIVLPLFPNLPCAVNIREQLQVSFDRCHTTIKTIRTLLYYRKMQQLLL